MQSLTEALRMLDAFASVGAHRFDVTFLDIDGQKRGFRAKQSLMQLRNSLRMLLPGLTERHNSLVVRPHPGDAALVQLDDLDGAALERLNDVAFLTLATSPRNHQAWVAVCGVAPADARDLGRRLRKGTGADLSASGATRVAGTVNYKRKYEPEFPTVTVLSATPGRMVTPETLEQLGLLARQDVAQATPLRVSSTGGRSWPDYQRCVNGAPLNHGKSSPDISRADFFWCLMAAQRGWGEEEIAARLMELSGKARENGEAYARLTAQNATAACARQLRSRV
jgi:hypothetical protein